MKWYCHLPLWHVHDRTLLGVDFTVSCKPPWLWSQPQLARLPAGFLRDPGGEQLPAAEGAAGEAEGDRLPEEAAGGEGAGRPAAGETHQVSGHTSPWVWTLESVTAGRSRRADWTACECVWISDSGDAAIPESPCSLLAPGSEGSADVELSAVEADQDMTDHTG